MASIDTYLGFQWGVDKFTLTENEGLVQPKLLSAVAQDPNTVRMSFDIAMMFLEDPGSVLKVQNWSISEQVFGDPLPIYWISKVSDTVVDIHVSNMRGVDYNAVTTAVSAWDQAIDSAHDTASFTGIVPSYPTTTELNLLFGLDSGLQTTTLTDFDPDVEGPYLANQSPFPGQTGLSQNTIVTLDILDDGSGVDESSVILRVQGVDAYKNSTEQSGFTVVRTTLTNGFRYSIDADIDFPVETEIEIYIYAQDQAPLPNVLETTYSFTTETGSDPVISNYYPAPYATNVDPATVVSFDITDANNDLDPTTVIIGVNGTTAYAGLIQKNGFSVVRTPVVKGFSYEIVSPINFTYSSDVRVSILARDTSNRTVIALYSFQITEDDTCFFGPLTEFEETLKNAYITVGARYLEQLRRWLLRNVLNVIHLDRSIRFIYLRAYTHPASTILTNLAPTPTGREMASRLCGQRTNIQINNDMRQQHPQMLERALTELTLLGVPDKHRRMLEAYVNTGNPNDRVPVACIMLILARVLEDNELV